MNVFLHWLLVFGLPLGIVAFLYFLLEQGKYLTKLDGSYGWAKIKVSGPAALYIILVLFSMREFPQPKLSTLTIRLWPSANLQEKLLKDNDARVYLSLPGISEEYSDFAPAKDFLEETQSVDSGLWDQEVAIRIAPTDKYVLGTSRVVCRYSILEISVLSPGATSSTSPAGSQGNGPSARELVSASPVPLRTDLPIAAGGLDSSIPLQPGSLSLPVLVSVEGQHLDLSDRLKIVDAQGKDVPRAWVGDSVGAANGKPVVAAKDGGLLKAYLGLPAASSQGSYFLRVERPDGAAIQIPISTPKSQK
jgi:hypothetical protein